MTRDDERELRSHETPIIGALPSLPGIRAAMALAPGLGTALRALANALLVDPFPGTTLTRAERELLATATSAANDCFYCMDSHGAFARELLEREGVPAPDARIDALKSGDAGALGPKLEALVAIASAVREHPRALTRAEVERALVAGASDADTQLAVLISAAFCMYNRMVDGFRAKTPADAEVFRERAGEIAAQGYSTPTPGVPPRG